MGRVQAQSMRTAYAETAEKEEEERDIKNLHIGTDN